MSYPVVLPSNLFVYLRPVEMNRCMLEFISSTLTVVIEMSYPVIMRSNLFSFREQVYVGIYFKYAHRVH